MPIKLRQMSIQGLSGTPAGHDGRSSELALRWIATTTNTCLQYIYHPGRINIVQN